MKHCLQAGANAAEEAALQTFVAALKPTFATIKAKCPDMSEGDVQLLVLLFCDFNDFDELKIREPHGFI